METQFDRQKMLMCDAAMERLQRAHVAVVGVGGVGSYTAEALARAGVGAITLIDNDTVSLTNLNRQLLALHSTIGQNKALVMAARIADINPDCRVTALPTVYDAEHRELLFADPPDYIADAIDSVTCKLDLIETAISRNIPIISSMGTGNRMDPSQLTITDLSKTSGCPLARVMRRELRSRGITHHTVLCSTELPLCPRMLDDAAQKRSVPGSVAWVPSCAGLMIAGYIIRQITEQD